MANNANVIKLLNSLGGMASESYHQGSNMVQRKGGQPMLPKPEMSMPHALSPYAPGNQGGGAMAVMGADGNGVNIPASPNSTVGAKPNEMSSHASNHPAAQLAEYLMTQDGASAAPRLKKNGVDPGAFIRGGM